MVMYKNLKIVLTIAIGIIIASSCSKKKGCTDSTATNYCSECKKDNGTCHYEGVFKHIFWFDKATSDSLIAHGYTEVSCVNIITDQTPYNGMPMFTTVSSNRYFSSAPVCHQNNILCISGALKEGESLNTSYVIADLTNVKENFNSAPAIRNWSGTVTIIYGNCLATQLIW